MLNTAVRMKHKKILFMEEKNAFIGERNYFLLCINQERLFEKMIYFEKYRFYVKYKRLNIQ